MNLTLENNRTAEQESSVQSFVDVVRVRVCCPCQSELKSVLLIQVPWDFKSNSGFSESICDFLEMGVITVAKAFRLSSHRNVVAVWLRYEKGAEEEIEEGLIGILVRERKLKDPAVNRHSPNSTLARKLRAELARELENKIS